MTVVSPKRLLAEWNLQPKHEFGQNFLSNPDIVERIARRLVSDARGTVIEIGAGLGALTSPLLSLATRVIAIERDRDLIPILRAEFSDAIETGRLDLMEEDAKTTDYRALFTGTAPPALLTGNLPYQLTGPLLRRVVELSDIVERCLFMVQLEVAERLCAEPGTSSYGALTVFVRARYSTQRLFTVGRGAFYPQPRVDSAVVELTPLAPAIAQETPLFRELVRRAFQQRRKMLRNAWRGLSNVADDQMQQAALRAGIDLNARGETLSVQDFARLTAELSAC